MFGPSTCAAHASIIQKPNHENGVTNADVTTCTKKSCDPVESQLSMFSQIRWLALFSIRHALAYLRRRRMKPQPATAASSVSEPGSGTATALMVIVAMVPLVYRSGLLKSKFAGTPSGPRSAAFANPAKGSPVDDTSDTVPFSSAPWLGPV